MYSLKGFISIGKLADNSVGNNAPLGELSTHSLTYSREIGKYINSSHPDVRLVSFSSQRTDVGKVVVDSEYSEHVLRVAQWIYEQSVADAFDSDSEAFISALTGQFAGLIEDVTAGEMVTDGNYWMPSYVIWKKSDATEDTQLKIWFSDADFQDQYDEYEIVIIPPVDDLDNLFNGYTTVRDLIEQRTLTDLMEDVQIKTAKEPYTYLRSEAFDWIDPNDSTNTITTNWVIAIYGIAGDTIDNIKMALKDYALANSTHNSDEWTARIPELFRVTEFIITPMWNKYGIPNQTLEQGIYSPIARVRDLNAVARQFCTDYDNAHVDMALTHMNFMYKSLSLLIVGSPENQNGEYVITDKFSDYIVVSTQSLDFNKMSPNTQSWVLLIYDMLIEAEKMTEFSDLPVGMGRLERDGVMYVVSNYNDVNYLVVAKNNFE